VNALIALLLVMGSAGCAGPYRAPAGTNAPSPTDIVITDRSQLEDAVGQQVTIIGVQTRTKIPTVCGVDVDGDYALSDREVIVRGVLQRYVVPEAPAADGLPLASRGPGNVYMLLDLPATIAAHSVLQPLCLLGVSAAQQRVRRWRAHGAVRLPPG
jgi:hypothetical protein